MSRVRKGSLLALVLIGWTVLMASSFDLNEPALEEEEDDDEAILQAANEAQSAPPPPAEASEPAQTSRPPAAPTVEQLRKLRAIYSKILKLFQLLELCDTDEFDINQVKIPENWADKAKALMVLNKIGKQKLIKKSDAHRYKRIMDNCNKIDAVFRSREESSLSLESQMSGMNDEDREKFRRDQEENPLDSLRSRFTMDSGATIAHKARQQAPHQVSSEAFATTRPPLSADAGDYLVLSNDHSHGQPQDDEGPQLIRFL